MYIYSWRLDCSILDHDHACVLADLPAEELKFKKKNAVMVCFTPEK
jgi:hypothetical protein